METIKKGLGYVWNTVESITYALGVFVVVYLFLFRPSVVFGMSSYPTIKPDERVIAEKVSYFLHEPQRGDFIILQSPNNKDVDFIKRIVGLPGEKLKISEGKVFVNGAILNEPYLPAETVTGPETFLSENQEIEIPGNHFFVMGDNREHSSDSRDFGPISKDKIVGKVVYRYFPLDRIGAIN